MKIYISMYILLVFTACQSWAITENSLNELTPSESKLLGDLPSLTSQTVTWNVPEHLWTALDAYLMKGKFFSLEVVEDSFKGFNVYKSKELSGKFITISPSIIIENNKRICGSKFLSETVPKEKFNDCNNEFCTYLSSKNKVIKTNFLARKFYIEKEYSLTDIECPYQANVIARDFEDKKTYNIKFDQIDPKGNYLKLSSGGIKGFLDIRQCKTKPQLCKILNFMANDYEKSWVELKLGDSKGMKELVENLLPCVKKKDKSCIKKYFVDINDFKDGGNPEFVGNLQDPIIDDDLINELEKCLRYESLLPGLLSSKGINKICRFSNLSQQFPPKGESKMLYVDYPGCHGEPTCFKNWEKKIK